MKAMLAGFVLIGVIAVGSDYALQFAGFSAQDRTSGDAVRLQ